MSGLAVTRTDPAAIVPATVKERRISKRIQQAVDALLTGKAKTQRQAAELANLNESHLSREMAKAHVQAFIARKTAQSIQRGTMRASARFLELIDAESEHVAAKVTERLLTSEGILKGDGHQVSVNVGVSVGYVIDLSGKAPTEKVIDGTG